MAKQNKTASDAPVDNQVADVVATDETIVGEDQNEAIQTTAEVGKDNNDNHQQGAAPENLGAETESETIETQGAELDHQVVGHFVIVGNAVLYNIPLDMYPREALEQIISDCELDINPEDLTDDEVCEAIDEAIQNGKAAAEITQAEYKARLSDSDKDKINKVAASVFAKRNYEALYFTSDGVPFETENTAKQHAAKLDNKAVVKRTKND